MLTLNDRDYLDAPGLSVLLGHDTYPEGHQAGLVVIQNGHRVASNGDLRLDPTPGQWQPVPRARERGADRERGALWSRLEFPDPSRDRRGFNPIDYPELHLTYVVRVEPDGPGFRVRVDLDEPLLEAWAGRVGFNLELFPGLLFGKAWMLDERSGIFPRQPGGPVALDARGEPRLLPLATGRRLAVAPECDAQRLEIAVLAGGELELLDGRVQHTNGWFVVRALVPRGASAGAVEWRVTPHALPGFKTPPALQLSQVGYHPRQPKVAVVELDPGDAARPPAVLSRVTAAGAIEDVLTFTPREWGSLLRFRYLQLDFSEVETPGLYVLRYGEVRSSPFRIAGDVLARDVWQPTLEYFLPIQMCHVRVIDRYRVWHGACHLDDARMAPVDHLHFDGYAQGPSTLCAFAPGRPVPGLDRGGWHDAGDNDLRVESQVQTVWMLSLAREAFGIDHDATTVDQARRTVELGRPDGRADILEQIQHGALSLTGAHRALGRLYRGIIEPSLVQYRLVGDPVNATDNRVSGAGGGPSSRADDRWVFTEQNPGRDLLSAAGLAAAARVLRGFDDALAADCLRIARTLWDEAPGATPALRTAAAVELLLATGDAVYRDWLLERRNAIAEAIAQTGWLVARVTGAVADARFASAMEGPLRAHAAELVRRAEASPWGVPYQRHPHWGEGWTVLTYGARLHYLCTALPELFPVRLLHQALGFVLGCHPGQNTASFVSGVGARSVMSAYGFNRSDGAHLPGGVVPGTALVAPDFPELLDWPFLWQQTEYLVSAAADYLFLVLAAEHAVAALHR